MGEFFLHIDEWMRGTPELFGIKIGYFLLLAVVILITMFIRWLLVGVIVKWLEKQSKKTETELDDLVIDAIKRPLGWIIIAVGVLIGYFILSGVLSPDPDELRIEMMPKITQQVKVQTEKQIEEQAQVREWSEEKKEAELENALEAEKFKESVKEELDKAIEKKEEDFENFNQFMINLCFSLIIVFVAWLLWKLVNNLSGYFAKKAEKTDTKLDDQLVPVARKLLKILIAAMTIAIVVQNLGYDVTGLIAGLGIGGIAFALAAQDTLGNMFGSATLFGAKPFQIGDFVKFGDIEGIVEEIGFRSTKIRKFDRHLVLVPNVHLSKGIVENVSSRGNMFRVREKVGITYSSTPRQIEELIEGAKKLIQDNEYTVKEGYMVYMYNFADSCIEILVQFFFDVPGFPDYMREKHLFMLDIMRLIDKLGLEFAFPSMTLYKYDQDIKADSDNNHKKFVQYMREKREQDRLQKLKELKDSEKTEEEKREEMEQKLKEKEKSLNELKEKIRKEEEETEEIKKILHPEENELTDDEKKVEDGLAKGGHIEEDE